MNKTKIGLTYEEAIEILKKNGWCYYENDRSWRVKAGDPLSEPVVTPEALRDVCEIYPSLSRPMLDLLLSGYEFDISITQIGFTTTVTLRPRPVPGSDGPPVFAGPIMS